MSNRSSLAWPSALLVALGLAVGGFLIGNGFSTSRLGDRYVTVKGLAEREVPADLVIWPLSFRVVSNDLSDLQTEIAARTDAIRSYMTELGFAPDEVSSSMPRIEDFVAQGYGAQNQPRHRYAAQVSVTLRTRQVDLARRGMQNVDSLVRQGVALTRDYDAGTTEFLFTGLNEIKPEMIAEATRNARRAAEQFAEDSGSRVGAIRKASQGFFSIDDLDRNSPHVKKVRVVATVEYFLDQ